MGRLFKDESTKNKGNKMLITGRLKAVFWAFMLLFVTNSLPGCFSDNDSSLVYKWDDAMAIANRNSGDLSLINTRTLKVKTIDLSHDGKTAEPMYVNHWRSQYADWGQILSVIVKITAFWRLMTGGME